MAADLFSIVPRRQLVDIFSDWLEISGIGRLDSAACNSTVRKLLLDFLKADCYIFRGDNDTCLSNCFFEWSIARQIKFTRFAMSYGLMVNHELRLKYLVITGKTLRTVDFSCINNRPIVADGTNEEGIDQMQHVFYDVGEHCPNLTRVTMAKNALGGTFYLLLTKCTSLQSLDISYCTGVSSSILRSICELRDLTVLVASNAHFLTHALSYRRVSSQSLQTLRLVRTNLLPNDKAALVCLFPNLTELHVDKLESPGLLQVVKACPLMKVAAITVLATLPDGIIQVLARTWSSSIRRLTIAMVQGADEVMSEAAMLNIIVHCKALWRLRVVYNDSRVRYGTPIPIQYPDERALQVLICRSVAASTLSAIVASCPNLSTLGIIQPAPEQGAPELAIAYPFHLLKGTAVRYLTFKHCSFAPACIAELSGVKEITFDTCCGVSDASLATMAQRCPQLERVAILSSPKLTMTALIKIVTQCPELQSLCFLTKGTEGYGDFTPQLQVIEALVRNCCPHLNFVMIR